MAKDKNEVRYDADGARRVMRTGDYMADFSGQLALGLMGNIVGQLTYFYTDKVGLAVGGVGIVMAIAKFIDAFTDVIFGNMIDHSKGGNKKYYQWMLRMAVPAAAIMILMFTVPVQVGQIPALAYVLITNLLLTAVIYTMIATPFSAVMVVRTNSQSERGSMGVFRAVGNYGAGMIISIATIPVTNILGGTQSAWIKYGAVLALLVLLLFLICYNNGRKAVFVSDLETEGMAGGMAAASEEEAVPFPQAMGMLLKNKYWVIVLMFNLITAVTNAISGSSGAYYCKWIFGNDGLVGLLGAVGMLATVVGFILSKPIIAKLGVTRTINVGLLGAAVTAAVRSLIPTNFTVYMVTGLLGSFIQIPLMCLYGVLLAMAVDYNEWKYDKTLVATASGAIGFGNKVGNGLGSLLLSLFLVLGSYDATLSAATPSMRIAIYGFSNYLPVVINLLMFFIFRKFDLEKKLPGMREEVAARKAAKQNEN
ncbi:MAG: sugar (glycoside-pentoside-Hexuronide) transporter [Ruminococcus sp.]|nr:sugar (glycoside-pentoside-Hexuronide) transporter [Ruminococcus sp.]